jgi:hypothetical protein
MTESRAAAKRRFDTDMVSMQLAQPYFASDLRFAAALFLFCAI